MPEEDSTHPLKRRQAVALRYQRGKDASPRVTASGRGRIAEIIMKKAEDAGVTLMEDPDLVTVLGKIPVGQAIPPQLYRAVAEVLAYVYRINKKFDGR
ncbi:MAG: EscU/YscU/HrcU family type III secretion system export apparatus switch protein [Magnetococcales bacterium]|nr:EscU/YscU/HrcU family type III secretion system export apparatus switch protein [Magnetococcales bacterium]MBF0151580.1 EscU/YscU/HrcU family type III secretion system export apparatus switch protein [Magnetococcales bacterium]MBF0172419.1 EscU/YscU/HrcU family type III secretion system export apparatus switch protein [Magnetococcales bacterium]MBF0631035.1 EscU/YscU/HrcU family type III secretion system export apparatus switch protein [Magnetococcales bacterium]